MVLRLEYLETGVNVSDTRVVVVRLVKSHRLVGRNGRSCLQERSPPDLTLSWIERLRRIGDVRGGHLSHPS